MSQMLYIEAARPNIWSDAVLSLIAEDALEVEERE
jgi:hypothetical protein